MDTEKVSVRQRVASEMATPPVPMSPFKAFTLLVVAVEGPLMTNESKSKRIWHMLLLHLQILARHAPEATVEADSKYVIFSDVEEPHPNETARKFRSGRCE